MKGRWKFLINFGIGLVLAFGISCTRGLFGGGDASKVYAALCDGFFVAAAIFLAGGGLTWCVNGGAVDGLSYTFKTSVARIRRDYEQSRKTFSQYREEREKKASDPRWMLLAGLSHLVIAIVFMALYSNV